MADNSKSVKHDGVDKSNWEWVEVPAQDIFGAPHSGVSINFKEFVPERNDNGMYTGKPGRYFVDPELAGEVRRLLEVRRIADMRILQPNQDTKLFEILRKGGKPVPNQLNF